MSCSHKLSEGVLEIIMKGGSIPNPLVQVLASKKITSGLKDSERYRLLISDGKFKINIAMYTVPVNNSDIAHTALNLYSIIALKRYTSNVIKNKDQDMRILLILDLELIENGSIVGRVLGDPISLSDNEIVNSQSSDILPASGNAVVLKRFVRAYGIYSPISSLNPFHNNWVIQARVTNKSNIRTWSNNQGDGSLFTVDFTDKWGSIRCTIFRELVDKFYDYLEVDKVYTVSKCVLKPINSQFCSFKHNFEMTVTQDSLIQESFDDANVPQIPYNYTTIDRIVLMDSGSTVDVLAVGKTVSELQTFTSKSSNKELTKREIVLVDQSKAAIVLCLWGSLAESFTALNQPIILIKNAKLREFLGTKSLSHSFETYIRINPEVPEARALRDWYESEGQHLNFNNLSSRMGNSVTAWLTFREAHKKILQDNDLNLYFQTVATILMVKNDRVVYKACPGVECMKKITDLENGMYRCEKCNREYPNFIYRFFISMNIADSSANQWVTVFSAEAEKILGKTAQEVGELIELDQENAAKIFDEINFKQYLFKCKIKMENYNDELKAKVIVVCINPVDFQEFNMYLSKNIEEMQKMV